MRFSLCASLLLWACSERPLGPSDLATVDAAPLATVGVPCAGVWCGSDEVCCHAAGTSGYSCIFAPLGLTARCLVETTYQCDGAEDCPNGEVCVSRQRDADTVFATTCAAPAPGDSIICHHARDCASGSCVPIMPASAGAPALGSCL